jgi:hypothetical protein
VRALQAGLWHWQAPHPDWTPVERWPQEVSSYAIDDGARLLPGDGEEAHLYAAGDRLPIGIEAFPGREHNDLVLWIESVGAVIPGDTLVDFGRGLEINEWLRGCVTRAHVVEGLRPLLALPVEVVLPTHGAPTDRAALERALF